MKVTVEVNGLDEAVRDLNALPELVRKATRKFVGAKARKIAKLAKPLTPVAPAGVKDRGALRKSVRSTGVSTRQGIVSAAVVAGRKGMGGFPAIVHEDLTLRHSVGGAKFIERPFIRETANLGDELLDAIDREVSR